MNDAIEEMLPLWRRISPRHIGLLLALAGVLAIGAGMWPGALRAEPALQGEQDLALSLLDETAALPDSETTDAATASQEDAPPTQPPLTVYVVGAVAAPGVYQVPAGARINDVIAQAGGLSSEADSLQINLAQPVKDGQQIHVLRQGEAAPISMTVGESAVAAVTTSDTNGLLNINHATSAELEALPRIGAALAQRIIEYREANGPFQSIEALREVKGLSESVVADITPLIIIQ